MSKYRQALPQLGRDFFMTDGGIETTLIFLDGHELPFFAAFHLLRTSEGEQALRKYFRTYGELARKLDVGLILETATWRLSPDWGEKLGYGNQALAEVNSKAVRLIQEIRSEYETHRRRSSSAAVSVLAATDTSRIAPCLRRRLRTIIGSKSRHSQRPLPTW